MKIESCRNRNVICISQFLHMNKHDSLPSPFTKTNWEIAITTAHVIAQLSEYTHTHSARARVCEYGEL